MDWLPHIIRLRGEIYRPSTLLKMLLMGYLYGIISKRQLIEEVQHNIAYRWFCGLDLSDNVPEHGLFSQNRRRKFHNAAIRKGFTYLPKRDCCVCMKGHHLSFETLVYNKPSQGYYRVYSRLRSKCTGCEYFAGVCPGFCVKSKQG